MGVKMKQIFLLLLIFAVSSHARDTVGNGSGRAERTVLFAQTNLGAFISRCFETDACELTQREYEILSKILNSLPEEKLNRDQIQFASELKTPGFFNVDGKIRVAKTGNKVASSIYVNVDLLYSKDEQGFVRAMNIAEATSMLVHEMGHHHGNYTHEELDILGVKVANVLDMQIYQTPAIPWSNDVYSVAINSKRVGVKTGWLVYVFDEITDLSDKLYSTVTCSDKTKPAGVMLYNLYWLAYPNVAEGTYGISANLALACKGADGKLAQDNNGKVTVQFSVAKKAMVPGTLKVEQN